MCSPRSVFLRKCAELPAYSFNQSELSVCGAGDGLTTGAAGTVDSGEIIISGHAADDPMIDGSLLRLQALRRIRDDAALG
jgi:hypothetical protein